MSAPLTGAQEAAERAFEPTVSTGVPRIAAMDGLRGIAILLVLWFHVWQITWLGVPLSLGHGFDAQIVPETGFVGVELFFLLSGFCVFYPFARAHFERRPEPAWRHFYSRRFWKIVPSYVLAVAVLVGFGVQRYGSLGEGARDVALHLAFVHNWFAATTGSISGVLWSLGVEVQFYAVFPLLCALFLRSPVATFAALVVLAAAFRAASQAFDAYYLSQLVNQLPAVADLFAVGMLVAYAYRLVLARSPLLALRRRLWTAVALAGVAASVVLLHSLYGVRFDHDGFVLWQTHYRTALALAFGLVAFGTLLAHPAWVAVVANPVTIFLGAISYNLYLWHQVVARLVAASIPAMTKDPHGDPHWQATVLFAGSATALVVATVATFFFERPLMAAAQRRRGQSPEKPRANELA